MLRRIRVLAAVAAVGCTPGAMIAIPAPSGPPVDAATGSTASPGSDPTTAPSPGATTVPPCAAIDAVERGYVPQDASVDGALSACTAAIHPTAGASGSVLTLSVDATGPVVVSAVDPGGRSLLAPTRVDDGAEVPVAPVVSGELLVTVAPVGDDATQPPLDYTLAVTCADGCDRWFTRYPVVLLHGLGGASAFGGVDYFYGVPGDLAANGAVVVAPSVSPFAPPADRAAEWSVEVDALLATGHRRVNLIAHSLGGLDARVLASPGGLDRGDVIASVTTIGTPHDGTDVADLIDLGLASGTIDPALLDLAATIFATLFGISADDPAFPEAIHAMTTDEARALDAVTPDAPDTVYGSWAGHSCGVLEPWCQDDRGGEVVDGTLAASYLLIWPKANDGLVPTASQHHGAFLGELWADHADEIGQIQDDENPAFDHLQFYRDEIGRLRALGL